MSLRQVRNSILIYAPRSERCRLLRVRGKRDVTPTSTASRKHFLRIMEIRWICSVRKPYNS